MTEHEHERRLQDEKIMALEKRLSGIEEKLDKLDEGLEGLIAAWNTGKGASTFLIATAKLATAGTVIWALLKGVKWSQFLS